jgi:hypothetical protein
MSSKQGPRAAGMRTPALTPSPSPAAAGEGSMVCASGAEMGWPV